MNQIARDITKVEPAGTIPYAPRSYTQLARDAAAAAEELHGKNRDLEHELAELKIANEVLRLTNERLAGEMKGAKAEYQTELGFVRGERDGYQRRYLNIRSRLRLAGQAIADTLIEDDELNAPVSNDDHAAVEEGVARIVSSDVRPQE
jgi:FtsZ-binding cell division protein ZapB